MFNTDDGLGYLADRRLVPQPVLATLRHFGLSSICNVLAAITTAKLLGLGPDDAIVTVATDGAAMYPSEREKILARDFGGGFTNLDAADGVGRAPRRRHDRPHHRVHRPRSATGSSTSATTRGSSSRARRSSCSRPAASQTFWTGLRRYLGGVGRDDHRVQRPGRRRVMRSASLGWRCAVCGADRRHRRRRTRSRARGRRRPIVTTSSTR